MTDFDVDLLLIRLIKQSSNITLFDLIKVVKEAASLFNEKVVEQLKDIDIFDNIIKLDDEIPVLELKKILINVKENLYGSYLRASSVMIVDSIKEQFIDAEHISQEELKYIDELFDSLLEMQRLYNFIKHFTKALKVPNLAEEINQNITQEKIRKMMEEKSTKRLNILKEIEDIQIKILDLRRERDKLINKITGKSKDIDFHIKALEEKLGLLRKQFKDLA
jgi:seryl-tRNA synthetase